MTVNCPNEAAVKLKLSEISKSDKHPGSVEIIRYGAFVGSTILCHDHLPRAMNFARFLIDTTVRKGQTINNGTVILADTMSASKGRFSRSWHAPTGGVWGCMIFANTLLPPGRNFISLAVGVACCEAIEEACGQRCNLRWVNDVLIHGKKLAGFLVESYTEQVYGEELILVGFGININNLEFPEELTDTATSLRAVIGRKIDLTGFTTTFLARLAFNFGILFFEESLYLKEQRYSGNGDRHLLLERWQNFSDSIGRRVIYGFDVVNTPQYQADTVGLDADGAIILRLPDGSFKTECCGEIRYV
jgi:BirA family transcriptional regulator, biotin operon repressor / biotin---[acetyl-CoA-carboxylase] ligase